MFVETKLEAKLNADRYNACEERTGEVFKRGNSVELCPVLLVDLAYPLLGGVVTCDIELRPVPHL